MEQHELLRFCAEILDGLQIPYFVTGSYAGILYGEYRMTNDIDIVIDLRHDQLDGFLQSFPPEIFYVDRDAAIEAVKTRFQFNLIHKESLSKVDFILAGGTSHSREELRRIRKFRGTVEYDVAYCSPEDLVLKKLQFHKQSASEKHLRDAAAILKKSGESMDKQYLENWADWLEVLPALRETQKRAAAPEIRR